MLQGADALAQECLLQRLTGCMRRAAAARTDAAACFADTLAGTRVSLLLLLLLPVQVSARRLGGSAAAGALPRVRPVCCRLALRLLCGC